jgi:pantetheine-phosphate adenylyltransferase
MSIKTAIYPGTFDPITNGHLDILDRALNVFSEVTIVVAGAAAAAGEGAPSPSGKRASLFTPEERVEMIREVTKNRPGVKVDRWAGLIMEYAQAHRVNAVIRGLRAASDFEYEFMMASMNKRIQPKVETLFMMTGQDLYFVSSSMIKELFHYGGDVSAYLHPVVYERLKQKIPLKKRPS